MASDVTIRCIQLPGHDLGPCLDSCRHLSCCELRRRAAALCLCCEQPIGYGRDYYREELVDSVEYGLAGCVRDIVIHRVCPTDPRGLDNLPRLTTPTIAGHA